MADEYLTVLLRMEGKMDGLLSGLGQVDKAQRKVGDSAKKTASEQDKWLGGLRKSLQNVRAAFGEYTGTVNLAKQGLGFLGEAADAFAKKNEAAGREWKEASSHWNKSLDSLKENIGSVVVKFAPLVDQLASVADLLGQIADNPLVQKALSIGADALNKANPLASTSTQTNSRERSDEIQRKVSEYLQTGNLPDDPWALAGEFGDALAEALKERGARQGMDPSVVKKITDTINTVIKPKRKGRGGGGPETYDSYWSPYQTPSPIGGYGHDFWGDEAQRLSQGTDAWGRPINTNGQSIGVGVGGGVGDTAGSIGGLLDKANALNSSARDQFQAGERDSMLVQLFGPIDEINGYTEAFSGLTNVVTAAFDAWATGSMSVGAAVKAAVAGELLAEGKKMAILALEHTAYGVGSLAIGGPLAGASAAGHFKSAALFAAGAVAAGVAGKALSGGAGAGAGSYGGANLGGGGSSGGGGGSNTTVIIGDYMALDNPREQRGRVARALRAVKREGDSNNGVRFG